MKLLFDFIPLLMFFATFKVASGHAVEAAALGTQYFGFAVGGGTVTQDQAPVLWATVVTIAATLAQVALLGVRRQKISPMLWLSLAIVVIMGGLTLWLNSDIFIKWKPTLLYIVFATILLLGKLVWGKNFLRQLLGKEITLPDAVWTRLLSAWIAFFVAVAALNIFVAYSFPTPTWVNFRVFGIIGLTLLFVLAQGLYMARFMQEAPTTDAGSKP